MTEESFGRKTWAMVLETLTYVLRTFALFFFVSLLSLPLVWMLDNGILTKDGTLAPINWPVAVFFLFAFSVAGARIHGDVRNWAAARYPLRAAWGRSRKLLAFDVVINLALCAIAVWVASDSENLAVRVGVAFGLLCARTLNLALPGRPIFSPSRVR